MTPIYIERRGDLIEVEIVDAYKVRRTLESLIKAYEFQLMKEGHPKEYIDSEVEKTRVECETDDSMLRGLSEDWELWDVDFAEETINEMYIS